MSATSEENRECPLCLEPLEMDDLNFFPCTCGYQICRFCWHRIRTNENGLCPACRKQYSEDPANFKPLTAEELQKIKSEKRQKDLQRKQKISENRKHLANVRVVQKNLVFVVGLPTRLADAEELRKPDYFGRFGKIVKVICNQSTSYAGTQGPSASAYVTYQRSEDALRAIQSVNNSKIDGRTLKASLGTTKYCSNFLKKLQCPKQDCMYLHELGDEAASFTKEDMQAGKHQEYEKKLYDQMIANSNPNRKESLNGDQGKASLRGGGSQRKKRRKQPSPTEPTDSTFFQKERWPSPPKREDHRSNSLSDTQSNSQSSPNNSSPELEPNIVSSEKNICQDGGASLEQFQNKSIDNHLSSPNTSDNPEEYRQTQVQQQPLPPQQQPPPPSLPPQQQIGNRLAMEPKLASVPPNHYNSSSFFQPIDSLSNDAKSSLETHTSMLLPKIPSQKSPPGIFSSVSQQQHMTSSPASSSSHLYSLKAPGFHSASMVNGLSAHTSSQLKNFVSSSSQDWSDGRAREFYKYKMSDMLMNGTAHSIAMSSATTNREDVNSSSSLFISSRNNLVPLNRSPGVQSGHDTVNHLYNGVNTSSRNLKNSYLPSENSSYCNQDDDLGFDPWHESAKGLADLMVKEADEKAKANGLLQNRNSAHFARRTVMPMDSTSIGGHCIENSHLVTRQTAPPPGFSNYGANSMSRPSYGDAFPNKMLPVMSMYNQSSAPHMTQYQQQIMHPSSGSFLNVLHATEAGLRPQAREWHESLTNMQQKNVDINFGNLISQRTPAHMGRVNSTMWNQTTNAPSEMPWVQQEQNLSHGFVENRNVSPNQLEKMLQQLKFNDQAARIQNHFKYSSLSSYRGGSS